MPRLKLLQTGITQDRAFNMPPKQRCCLPITAPRGAQHDKHDLSMLREATTLCFFSFFRSGEITVPPASTFNAQIHLAWGDVAINSIEAQTVTRIYLKQFKCNQIRQSTDMFVGITGSTVSPVVEIGQYMAIHSSFPGVLLV